MPTSCWGAPKKCTPLPEAETEERISQRKKTTRKTQPWYRNANFPLGRSKKLYAFAWGRNKRDFM
jgi:hypothetical protein